MLLGALAGYPLEDSMEFFLDCYLEISLVIGKDLWLEFHLIQWVALWLLLGKDIWLDDHWNFHLDTHLNLQILELWLILCLDLWLVWSLSCILEILFAICLNISVISIGVVLCLALGNSFKTSIGSLICS